MKLYADQQLHIHQDHCEAIVRVKNVRGDWVELDVNTDMHVDTEDEYDVRQRELCKQFETQLVWQADMKQAHQARVNSGLYEISERLQELGIKSNIMGFAEEDGIWMSAENIKKLVANVIEIC